MIENKEILFYMMVGYMLAFVVLAYLISAWMRQAEQKVSNGYIPLSKVLNSLRLAADERIIDLAAAVGISDTWTSQLCNHDDADPSLSVLRRFADHYNIGVSQLLSGGVPGGLRLFKVLGFELWRVK